SELSLAVQNVQNVQNRFADPFFESIEQIEQGTEQLGSFGFALATWDEDEGERFAIVELDGNIFRLWAEGFARLDSGLPTADIPPKQWQRLIDNVGSFLDNPSAPLPLRSAENHSTYSAATKSNNPQPSAATTTQKSYRGMSRHHRLTAATT